MLYLIEFMCYNLTNLVYCFTSLFLILGLGFEARLSINKYQKVLFNCFFFISTSRLAGNAGQI